MKNTELLSRGMLLAALEKRAESSGIGRWLALGSLASSQNRESPWSNAGARALVGLPGIVSPAVSHSLNFLGIPEMAAAKATYGEEEEREKNLKATGNKMRKGTYLDAASHGLKGGTPAAVLAGLLGAGAGAYLGGNLSGKAYAADMTSRPKFDLDGALVGGTAGAVSGASSALLMSLLRALWDKKVLSTVSPETIDRAAKVKGKHPYVTALPLGDVVGAASG